MPISMRNLENIFCSFGTVSATSPSSPVIFSSNQPAGRTITCGSELPPTTSGAGGGTCCDHGSDNGALGSGLLTGPEYVHPTGFIWSGLIGGT